MARTVQCIKLGKEAEGLDFPPYPGELGKRIWESVRKEAWAGCANDGKDVRDMTAVRAVARGNLIKSRRLFMKGFRCRVRRCGSPMQGILEVALQNPNQ